ncbi:MAG: GvpL/GvpF family gas vesicle protein [Candidatus Zixiibacteriota bacterium]
MTEKEKYVYGITKADGKRIFGAIGLGDPPTEVYTVSLQDVSAVVSDSPVKAYRCMTKDKVARDLLRHQSVIEKVMRDQAILPMKFGTFVEGEKDVARILETGHEQFTQALSWMRDKIELDVIALWDKESVFKELAEEREIKEFKEKIIANPAGPQLDDRISLGQMVEKSWKKKNLDCAQEILRALKEKALDFCTHDTLDNTMIINCSFLLEVKREKDFDEKLSELNERYENRINFRCVGPLAAYSFGTVEVKKIGFDAIDKAKRLLGLGEEITRSEIKSAHRRLVFECHPDKSPPGDFPDKKFHELNQAYQLLLEYLGSDPKTQKSGRRSLRKEDVKDSILVTMVNVSDNPERKAC